MIILLPLPCCSYITSCENHTTIDSVYISVPYIFSGHTPTCISSPTWGPTSAWTRRRMPPTALSTGNRILFTSPAPHPSSSHFIHLVHLVSCKNPSCDMGLLPRQGGSVVKKLLELPADRQGIGPGPVTYWSQIVQACY